MTKTWRITTASSNDPGFATAASICQAVTPAEFRSRAEHVARTTPDKALPAYTIDYTVSPSPESASCGNEWRGLTIFPPCVPLLDTRAHANAPTGIWHRRGAVATYGNVPWLSKEDPLRAPHRHAIVAERFEADC